MINSRNCISHLTFLKFIKNILEYDKDYNWLISNDSFFKSFKKLIEYIQKNDKPEKVDVLTFYRARVAPVCFSSPFFPWNRDRSEKFDTAVPNHGSDERFYLPQKNKKILIEELGAREDEYATAARWNFDKVSVFYAGEDIETAITEVRAEFNRHVWISRYETDSSNLLDLFDLVQFVRLTSNQLQQAIPNISTEIFDEFIRNFNRLVSAPCPNDNQLRELHYRPTQYISKLIHSCGYQGFIFRSSLTGKRTLCFLI